MPGVKSVKVTRVKYINQIEI